MSVVKKCPTIICRQRNTVIPVYTAVFRDVISTVVDNFAKNSKNSNKDEDNAKMYTFAAATQTNLDLYPQIRNVHESIFCDPI